MDIARFTSPYRSRLIKKVYANWLKKDEKVLDIGCGNGLISLYLMNNLSVKIVGCDVNNYLSVPVRFVQIPDSYKLPLEKNSFDASMLNDVLHHIKKPQQIELIKEALRVSSRVLVFEAKPTFLAKVFDIILNKLHYGDLKVPLSFRDRQEWEELCNSLSVKFEIIELKRPFWYPFSHIALLLKRS